MTLMLFLQPLSEIFFHSSDWHHLFLTNYDNILLLRDFNAEIENNFLKGILQFIWNEKFD